METPRERAILATPIPSGRAGVLTPFQFVFSGEDRLRVSVVNIVAGVTIRVSWRFLDLQRAASVANRDDFVPTADGNEISHEISVGTGALSNVVVRAIGQRVEPGECFVRIDVIRGTGAAALILGTLLSGYVGSWGGRGWPGSTLDQPSDGPGRIKVVQSAVPAAGANPFVTLPDQTRWRVLAAEATLTTSGAGGARTPLLALSETGVFVFRGQSSLNQAPGGVMLHDWGAGVSAAPGTGTLLGQGPIPVSAYLSNRGALNSSVDLLTNGIDVADQWSVLSVLVEEWRNPVTTFLS